MTSIADLVAKSVHVDFRGLTLLVPDGYNQQTILMGISERRKPFRSLAEIEAEKVLDNLVHDRDGLKRGGARVYILAPGDWNNNRGYHAVVCNDGISVMSPLEQCGYNQMHELLMKAIA